MTEKTKRPLADQFLDLLEGMGMQATIDGKPVSREQLKSEVGRRVKKKVRGWAERLAQRAEERIAGRPPQEPPK